MKLVEIDLYKKIFKDEETGKHYKISPMTRFTGIGSYTYGYEITEVKEGKVTITDWINVV